MRNRRKQIIVNKSFQYRQGLATALVAIIAANTMIILAFRFFPYELNAVIGPFTWSILIFEIILIVAVMYFSAKASRKIAGPAFALKRVFGQLGEGDLSARAHLRKGDHLHDVAEAFNTGADRLEERLGAIRSSAEGLSQALPQDSSAREQAGQLLSQLDSLLSAPPSETP